MDDDVEKIQHQPAGLQCAIDRPRPDLVLLPQLIGDFIGNSPQMRFAGPGGDHKIISNGRNLMHVQHQDIFRLFVVCQFAAENGQLF